MLIEEAIQELPVDVNEIEDVTKEIPIDVNGFSFGKRRKRHISELVDVLQSFDQETILLALANAVACNPILRAAANSIIEQVEL